jgi:NADH-quinone oxidoreductase subunit C
MNSSLKKSLESVFKEVHLNFPEKDRLIINVKKDQAMSILKFLKEKGYEHLALVSCIDWIEEKEFELVYVLSSYLQNDSEYTEKEKANIILKTIVPRDNPRFFTTIPIFQNSEPYEREIHELYGIHFEGHPRQIPLFLERDYKIPPFRKDFDTRQYVKQVFDNIPSVEDRAGEK